VRGAAGERASAGGAGATLLDVRALSVSVETASGRVRVVDDVSFSIPRGRALALVGESGCGKTMTALSIVGLLPEPGVRVESGRVLFDGLDLASLDDAAMRRVRGRRIGFVFQEPAAALDPVRSCGDQVAEAVRAHERVPAREAWRRAVEALRDAGVPAPERRARAYPHELSGGLRQRAVIAASLVAHPELLIADEPTASLDVTIQVQIVDLLSRLRRERSLSLLLITHDLALAAEAADEVAVMYAGRIVESGPVARVFEAPRHPYTLGLLEAAPAAAGEGPLRAIPGTVPAPGELSAGCRFAPRCFLREDICVREEPPLEAGPDPSRAARCWFSDRVAAPAPRTPR